MFYRLAAHLNSQRAIFFPEDFKVKNSILDLGDSIIVYTGGGKCIVNFSVKKNLKCNEIKLSEDVIKKLCIPTDINYQIRKVDHGIRIGPVIGLLLAKKDKELNTKKLDRYLEYTFAYPKFQGLIYIFSEEGIDCRNGTIEGFYLKIDIRSKTVSWEKSILPYPDSVYRRIGLSKNKREFMKEVTNNNMFNSYYFDKLEFWRFISSLKVIREYVPDTAVLKSFEDISEMLNRHKFVYLKLANSSLARGLIKVWKENNNYYFKGKYDNEPNVFGEEQAKGFIRELKGNYLVQQGIECLSYENRPIDFRVIMQKDNTKTWSCTGIVCSLGMNGGICSNYETEGYALSFEDIMFKLYQCKEEFTFRKKQEIVKTCKRICEVLDLTGETYGDFGMDIAIDLDLKLWVLEINKRHYHRVPLSISDIQTYYSVKTKPIKYALALSGFSYLN